MFDKLIVNSNSEIMDNNLREVFGCQNIATIPDAIYRSVKTLKNGENHLLTIKTNPVWSHTKKTKIELNPVSWESFNELNSQLSQVIDPDSLNIVRIDHCVDIDETVQFLFEGLRMKYKQNSSSHFEVEGNREGITGFYIGREPELLCVYDKAYEITKRKKLKKLRGEIIGQKTRIELRQSGRAVPVKEYTGLKKYLEIDPFGKVEFLILDAVKAEDTRIRMLEALIGKNGLTNTYNQLNKHNNFKRNFKKVFKGSTITDQMKELYWNNLGQFFGDEYENA